MQSSAGKVVAQSFAGLSLIRPIIRQANEECVGQQLLPAVVSAAFLSKPAGNARGQRAAYGITGGVPAGVTPELFHQLFSLQKLLEQKRIGAVGISHIAKNAGGA